EAFEKVPGAADVLTADLSRMAETRELAAKVNELGNFDAIIHNAAVYNIPNSANSTDGLPLAFAVNTIAPYILTCLVHKPKRIIYMTSGMHSSGSPDLDNLAAIAEGRNSRITYSDTKLHDVMLAFAVARKWPDVYSNTVNPGWVPTRMGGPGAPDKIEDGFQTQVWLAVSDDSAAKVSGRFFHHKRQSSYLPAADDVAAQEKLLEICAQITGIRFLASVQQPQG
ncbi:MAG TPA: daunorubicin C-13 ketoreductase, partial [Chitinophagaceae bacterium]